MPVYTAVSITTPVPDRKMIGADLEEEIEDEEKLISKITTVLGGLSYSIRKTKQKRIFLRTNSFFFNIELV